jgi:hypothetical protein
MPWALTTGNCKKWFLAAILVAFMHSFSIASEHNRLFISGSFAPATLNGWDYISGGGKAGYLIGKKYFASVRYLAESTNRSCWDCPGIPGRTLHEVLDISVLYGPCLLGKEGYFSALAGIGVANVEMVNYSPESGEIREKTANASLDFDVEAMKFLGNRFGIGLTGYGSVNPVSSIFGVMLSLQFGML